jgi:PadR family transcriptional regulator, regulatory protein AphA
MTKRTGSLTTTSYAVLGLLCLHDWSTYELTKQMQRSMRLWWPRAESRVYEEPKRLLRLGLVTASDEGVGGRPRTVYSITPMGRSAFEGWLDEPGRLFRLEFEGMLKVFFADQGTKPQLLERIADIAEAARGELERGLEFDDEYVSTGGPFPERLHIIALVTDLYLRILDATLEWAEEAEATVARWRSTRDGDDPRPAIAARRRANRDRLDR